jgi:hypothetical protein
VTPPNKAAKHEKANPVLRAAIQAAAAFTEPKEDWEEMKATGFVNYASAPLGGQTYDANWLATNTAAR